MAKCPYHGWMYLAGAGAGRNKYTFCSLCRTLRAAEAVCPGETSQANSFLSDHAKVLAEEKSKFRTTTISTLYRSTDDSKLSRREVVVGEAEDQLWSTFGTMADRWDVNRAYNTIGEIMKGSVRAAASKYDLDPHFVFDLRLLIEMGCLEEAIEKLLAYVPKRQKRQQEASLAAQKLAS